MRALSGTPVLPGTDDFFTGAFCCAATSAADARTNRVTTATFRIARLLKVSSRAFSHIPDLLLTTGNANIGRCWFDPGARHTLKYLSLPVPAAPLWGRAQPEYSARNTASTKHTPKRPLRALESD